MEELLKQLLDSVNDIKENVLKIDNKIHHLEQRLERLEKVDSIEHRVAVNQIDLSDIKEIVEKVETFQREEVLEFIKNHRSELQINHEINQINKRLDAHLTKLAHNEEAILMITKEK